MNHFETHQIKCYVQISLDSEQNIHVNQLLLNIHDFSHYMNNRT